MMTHVVFLRRLNPQITDVNPLCVTSVFRSLVFTALHGMQTRSSDDSVCLPSAKRVNCDKTEEKSVQIFIPYEISYSLVF